MAIALIILAVLAAAVILPYNGLVTLRNRFRNAYAQIDVQLKRRHDLIPNLVETAKGYLQHERGTLEEVTAARTAAVAANSRAAANPGDTTAMRELSGAETALSGSLGRLFAVAESYPDLKANTLMKNLMEELTSAENRVAFARQSYNDAVTAYNTKREVFPSNLIANSFGFTAAELFVVQDASEKQAVNISL